MSDFLSIENTTGLRKKIESFAETCNKIKTEISNIIVGHNDIIDGVLIAILAGGHVLLEGVPGIGKTLLVKTFAKVLNLNFSRIQFTPDLMPADVTGTMILVDRGGRREFEFNPGPVFSNIILADEINRATPKTQSALLEAMQERKVTVLGQTRDTPFPFVILATQNPIEMEGTYPLPEAQLDRFLIKLLLKFPNESELLTMMERTTVGNEKQPVSIVDTDTLTKMIQFVREMQIENKSIFKYASRLVRATHPENEAKIPCVRKFVRYGVSPRGAQALILCGKVRALMKGNPAVDFDDIKFVAPMCLRHRIILNFEGESSNISTDEIINEVIQTIPEL